jgi:argininosuccinate synthase
MFAQYGVGRGMYTGDTTIGLKGRIVYEAPGLTALLVAHRALEEAEGFIKLFGMSSTLWAQVNKNPGND